MKGSNVTEVTKTAEEKIYTEVDQLKENNYEKVTFRFLSKPEAITQLKLLDKFLEAGNVIQSLDFSYGFLDNNAAACVADILRKNNTIKSLNLNNNYISEEGMKKVFDSLEHNQSLQCLQVRYNRTTRWVSNLFDGFTKNTCLKKLDIGANNLGKKGFVALTKALKENKSLETLIIDTNSIISDNFPVKQKKFIKKLKLNYSLLKIEGLYTGNIIHSNDLEHCNAILKRNDHITENKKKFISGMLLPLPNDVQRIILSHRELPNITFKARFSRVCRDAYKASEPNWATMALAGSADAKQSKVQRRR